ncbi:MAG: site-specific DNA-methyltransferase [Phycisphaerae bacterium]|nr:site-specific DNA-methyltransferase [Phycisphaerae bacterium]NUQ09528.1 site-specific DNA-methyltransferase [Phycisphaerae bacterium]
MKPCFDRDGLQLFRGDCLELMQEMPADSVDTIITDPPYGLGFMGKAWDTIADRRFAMPGLERKKPWPRLATRDVRKRLAESSLQEFHRRWSQAALRVAKPGALLLAFGSTRTFHRLACGLEDAGWQIRDCFMWLYGCGFPKSLNIGKAMSKAKEGESKSWAGWGTGLKPAWEPIILAMKPLEGTFAENAARHGLSGLNIDAARIQGAPGEGCWGSSNATCPQGSTFNGSPKAAEYRSERHARGRWPANLLFTHHLDCQYLGVARMKGSASSKAFHKAYPGKSVTRFLRGDSHPGNQHADRDGLETLESWDCHPECPVRMLDERSGMRKSGSRLTGNEPSLPAKHVYGAMKHPRKWEPYLDRGGASRFFYCSKAPRAERNLGLSGEDNDHPTVKPLGLMEYLCRLTATPSGGLILDPFAGTGTTLLAARNVGRPCVGIEIEAQYVEIAKKRLEVVERPALSSSAA